MLKKLERFEPKFEEEPKEEERMLEKFLKGRREHFFEIYKLMSENERKRIKESIRTSNRFSEEEKEKLLSFLEECVDKEAEKKYEDLKDLMRNETPGERKKWVKEQEERLKAIKAAAEEIKEEELKMKDLSDKERMKLWFKRMSEEERKNWEVRIAQLKNLGIDEGIELDAFHEAMRELELEEERLKEMPPEEKEKRKLINYYKNMFIRENLSEEERNEQIEWTEKNVERFHRVLKEVEETKEK